MYVNSVNQSNSSVHIFIIVLNYLHSDRLFILCEMVSDEFDQCLFLINFFVFHCCFLAGSGFVAANGNVSKHFYLLWVRHINFLVFL